MRALTCVPGRAGTVAVTDLPEPEPGEGELLVDGLAVGMCGTDREIASAEYGAPPPGERRLVLGHESLGRVRQGVGSFAAGDLVVGVVRRPDPVPCGACARGEFDMCRNGRYTERGIKGLHGFASERWVVEADYAVPLPGALERVGMLLEPTTVVAKAWEQVDRIGGRSWYEPERVLVTGAGPIGLLAAMIGVQRGLEVHVLDQVTDGPKPDLVADLGATYHATSVPEVATTFTPDVVIEATGASAVVIDAIAATGPYGITCLTGVSSAGRRVQVDVGAANREIVLENDVVVGSVNANLSHYRSGVEALTRADPHWLERLITRRVPLDHATEAFQPHDGDVKVVIDLDR
jgi:threonine dehydrogenase-like Zn-dependent dehydrogenase